MMNEPMKRSNLFCDGVSRRQALRIGASGFLGGLTLPKLFQMEATASNGQAAKAKSCIFLYLQGGPSTIDMWDMKPDAPIRNACLLETPSQKRFDRFIGSFIMMTFPFKSEAFYRYINGCKRIP